MSLLSFFMTLMGCAQEEQFKSVGVKEFEQTIADTMVMRLDVRTDKEFSEGHIDGAINIDVLQDSFIELAKAKLPKNRTIAMYCRSGRRSKSAARMLAKEGYNVVELNGGYIEWQNKQSK